MPDYILLMHDDAAAGADKDWSGYIATLRASGNFQGGSAIGDGTCARRAAPAPTITRHFAGYIRVGGDDIDHALRLVAGNPVYEAGGTVEIRELPRTD